MSTAQEIYDVIRQEIIYGILKPNEKITEVLWAKRFGTSRGPVRDALRRLEGESLIISHPDYAGRRVVSFSPKQTEDLWHVIMLLECAVAKNAALYANDSDIQNIENVLKKHEEIILKYQDISHLYQEYNEKFHFAIVKAGKNTVIEEIIMGELYIRLQTCRNQNLMTNKKERHKQSILEHKAIFQAIKEKDAPMAELLMQRHMEKSRNHIF